MLLLLRLSREECMCVHKRNRVLIEPIRVDENEPVKTDPLEPYQES